MILSYLSGRQVSAACHAAQQKGDYRLALLLSQVAGSSEFRHMVQRQLGDWEQTKVCMCVCVCVCACVRSHVCVRDSLLNSINSLFASTVLCACSLNIFCVYILRVPF